TGRDIENGDMTVRGDLAEKWDVSDDGLTWTFNLRKGVKWQNVAPVSGREFTSADVACTIHRIQTFTGAVQAGLMGIVTKVDTPDPYTAVFQLSQPFAGFDQSVASYNMEIIPCEADRGEFDLKTTAIGTGPFILQTWDRKVSKTYIKNPNYFEAGKPHLDKLVIDFIVDPAAQIAAFRTSQMDVIAPPTKLYPTVITTNPDAVARSQTGLTMTQIMINQKVKPFDDVRVRKAVAMAWDRDGMAASDYQDWKLGTGYPATLQGGLTPDESKQVWPFDPAGAKKLLAEAGYPNGFDVDLTLTDGYGPIIVNEAQWIQQDLKAVGINVTLRQLDYATYFSTVLTSKADYAIGYGYASGLGSPDEWLQSFYTTGSSRNSFGISDPKLDKMIEDQRGILDRDKRTKALHDIAEYIGTNVVTPIVGFQAAAISVQQTWVHNLYGAPAYERAYVADTWVDKNAPSRK
ncbi:MAG: ABC-type dipeptide transport system, periplasmic component, partial [Jatrophihabitantaceae bacterium]|nr:ABC-type dipeptide transport system, periplasmic component [Jatrophihabitantaceae bacterium]